MSWNGEAKDLGLDRPISRRDFVNAVLVGVGGGLMGCGGTEGGGPSAEGRREESYHPWTGPGGVGDYARSNGNTWPVVQAAHRMRDGGFQVDAALPTGERYDLVVVGGGFSGLGAAWTFLEEGPSSGRVLVLDNHPVFGGEAKENVFEVAGRRLVAPQGSNDFVVESHPDSEVHDLWRALGVPDEYRYGSVAPGFDDLPLPRDNYYFQLWNDAFSSHGFHFGETGWVRDIWSRDLEGTPWPPELRRAFLRWRRGLERPTARPPGPWLDTMSYQAFLARILGLPEAVARYVDPVCAASVGLGADAISAWIARELSLPGFQGYSGTVPSNRLADIAPDAGHSFPGGNAGLVRHLVRLLVPDALTDDGGFASILRAPIRFDALDRSSNRARIRLSATVVAVQGAERVRGPATVVYARDGRLESVEAGRVVVAGGGWTAQHIVAGLPADYREAFRRMERAPILVVNVALRRWRPLYDLGVTACRWFDGFGFACNLRAPMWIDDDRPDLHPDEPAVLTFYVPYGSPGLPVREQVVQARSELLGAPFRSLELAVRRQLATLFGEAGLDPARDVAGIVTNRWGHAYVVPAPGFFFGVDGAAPPPEVIRRPFGRVSFANAELRGHQTWRGAVAEGRRAVREGL